MDIYSTMPTYHVTLNDYGYAMNYDYLSGTSMACPCVAGAAALAWSRYASKTKDWVRLWMRYTADDLGDPGFDVYYGYGRINARNIVEQTPPAHELIAYDYSTPPYVKPGTSGVINATVLNFGENDETGVTVQLLANDTVVDSELIGSVASGNWATVSFTWTPTVVGLYNVTFYAVPVPGEANLDNNVISKYIFAGLPVKAVVLRSSGNIDSDAVTNWQVLTNDWYLFGDTMASIDYTTLNKQSITYEDIAATEADVLIISCAYDPYVWQFTDSEIEAITRYVQEGHGLIATAGTFYNQVPNNNKLAPLFGISETTSWTATTTDLMDLQNTTHPIFTNVPNPLVFPLVSTALPNDGRWDSDELIGGKYLALGHFQESAVVTYRGLVYISPWLEVIPAYYHHPLQLLYNAIRWSRYVRPQHELVVSLEAPKALKPGRSALLDAVVSNMGLNNETTVGLQLLINNMVVNSTTIPELSAGESFTLDYLWTPPTEGTYNITAYASPVHGEENVLNNVKSLKVLVSSHNVALFENNDPWNYPADQRALDRYGVPYVVFSSSDFGKVDLSAFSKVVIASDQDQVFYNDMDTYRWWFESYASSGGTLEIHAADWGWHGGMWIGPLPGGLMFTFYPSDYVAVVDPAHPVLNTPNAITGAELDNWYASVHGYFTNLAADAHVIIVESYTGMAAYLEFAYGAGFITASSQTLEFAYMYKLSLILENSLLYMAVRPDHDLAVNLESPLFLEVGNSTLLNATVVNKGLNSEKDVGLYLLINGAAVTNVTIPELLAEYSYTMIYAWSGMGVGNYNVTAYVPPVSGEAYVTNNVASRNVGVFYYQEQHISHEWVGGGAPMGWHGDDGSWQFTLPFDFPFYGVYYSTIFVSSNGLLTFTSPDFDSSNSLDYLAAKLAIAPAWYHWVTFPPYDIFIWQNSTQVGIRWAVFVYATNVVANFEVILSSQGVIQFDYGDSNGAQPATAGISNGAGHVLGEDLTAMNNINTMVFMPFPGEHDVAIESVKPSVNKVKAGEPVDVSVVAENNGTFPEDFTVTAYASLQGNAAATAHAAVSRGVAASLANQTGPAVSLINPGLDGRPADWTAGPPRYLGTSDFTFYSNETTVGSTFFVNVTVSNVANMFGWGAGLVYDSTMMDFVAAWLPSDHVFAPLQAMGWSLVAPAVSIADVDVTHKEVQWGCTYIMGDPPWTFNGTGTLCQIEFRITKEVNKASPRVAAQFVFDSDWTEVLYYPSGYEIPTLGTGSYEYDYPMPPTVEYPIGTMILTDMAPGQNQTLVFIWNTTGVLPGDYLMWAKASWVPYELNTEDNVFADGNVTVAVSTVHDVAVTDVAVPSNVVYEGWTVGVNVTVVNLGNGTENFAVTLSYNGTSIGTLPVNNLGPNATLTLSFSWDTTNVPCGNCIMSAEASVVPGETNVTNNVLVDGTLMIKMMGDISGDGKVDMGDIVVLLDAFGSQLGHPRWNPNADFDQNGKIDMGDVVEALVNFGKKA